MVPSAPLRYAGVHLSPVYDQSPRLSRVAFIPFVALLTLQTYGYIHPREKLRLLFLILAVIVLAPSPSALPEADLDPVRARPYAQRQNEY